MANINKYTYFKPSDDASKTGKFCLGGQDLAHTGIKDDSNLLQSFKNGKYAYYKDSKTKAGDGTITPTYDDKDGLYGTYDTSSSIGNVACPLNTGNVKNVYNTQDVDCSVDGAGNNYPGCEVKAANTCVYANVPEQSWICDWSKGCTQIGDVDSQQNKFDDRIDDPRRNAMGLDSELQVYTSEYLCKQQCMGPYSRCNTNLNTESVPGYPSWNLEEPTTYEDGHVAKTQNWFYCDKNVHCHTYKVTDPCFCSYPESIPLDSISHNPAFPQYAWNIDPQEGAFANLITATPVQDWDHDVPPTAGTVGDSDEIIYESNNWFKLRENDVPTKDKPWLVTKSGNYWPNVCDFTDKQIKYQCGSSQDPLRTTGFCNSTNGDPVHRLGMMSGGDQNVVDFDKNECTNNDLTSIQLPQYTNNIQFRTDKQNQKGGGGFVNNPKGPDWSGDPNSDETYVNKRLNSFYPQFGAGFAMQHFKWDKAGPTSSNDLETVIAPFNCVDKPAQYPVYTV